MSDGSGATPVIRRSGGHGAVRASQRTMVLPPEEADWAEDVIMELACIARVAIARTAHTVLLARAADRGRAQACLWKGRSRLARSRR